MMTKKQRKIDKTNKTVVINDDLYIIKNYFYLLMIFNYNLFEINKNNK